MALIYYVGGTPIFEDEANQKLYTGELEKFDRAFKAGESFSIDLENGLINSQQIDIGDFTPIGVGKPLSIEIVHIYTGDAPDKFLGKKDLLLTSGVKSITTYSAAPKAINQLIDKIEDYKIYSPSAGNNGSPIVYYTPALDMNTIQIEFSMVADTFNEETFNNIGKLLTKAGGIPVFAAASSVLLAGGILSNMVGNLGKAFLESKDFYKGNLMIKLDSPGQIITKAKNMVIIDDEDKDDARIELKNYESKLIEISPNDYQLRLANSNNEVYKGKIPYVLISLDGRTRQDLSNFAPTIATAAILVQFYGVEDVQGQSVKIIEEALILYNDLKYHKEAKKIKNIIKDLPQDSNKFKNQKILFDAYNENIQKKDLFKIDL